MKKCITFFIAVALMICFIGCGNSNEHIGEAKTPSGSSIQKGRDYNDVVNEFKEHGFLNIKLETQNDLIFGWLTKDGEVESVSVDGDIEYIPDRWYPNDVEVIITYHTFPEDGTESNEETSIVVTTSPTETVQSTETVIVKKETLTVENCAELQAMLSVKNEFDNSFEDFAEKYEFYTISFDGCITYISEYEEEGLNRWDFLINSGDYVDENTVNPGPIFKFDRLTAMSLAEGYPSDFEVGQNVHVVAMVQSFDMNSGLFYLDPYSLSVR